MGHRYPQPDNEDGFEQLCVRFYRKLWDNMGLKLYAKRGEKQDGIDIFDPFSINPVGAIQCKFHEPHKTLPPAEIKAEVIKAENSAFKLERYVIATTAQKTKNAQDTVVELNRRREKQFEVDIHFWEDICADVGEFGRVVAELIIYGENILAGALLVDTTHLLVGYKTPDSTDQGHVVTTSRTLAEIEKLLDERRFAAARHEMEKQPDTEAAKSLPVNDQYLLLRFRGRLAMEDGDWAAASKLFVAAYEVAPDSDQAKQNHVLGLSLGGNRDKAYEAAKEHIGGGVRTNVMAARVIDCVSSLDQLAEQSSLIDQYREIDADLNTALCHKYIEFGAFDDAIHAAEQALLIAPDSPHAHLATAMAAHTAAVHLQSHRRVARLKSAVEHYDKAQKRAAEDGYRHIIPEAVINRGAAYVLLDRKEKAAADFRGIVNVVETPSPYANRSVEFFLQEEDYRSAWDLLDAIDRTTNEGQYLALVTEYHNGTAEERETALVEMLKLADTTLDREVDCRSFCVQWSIDLKDYERAKTCLSQDFVQRHAFQAKTLFAWIHRSAGEEAEARNAADEALASSIENARKQDLRLLARILIELKDDASALGLLEEVAQPGFLDDDMKALINCAQRLERHDLLLRLCEELREAGTSDSKLQRLEVDLLNRYAPERALEVTKELKSDGESKALFTAYHNYLLVRLNRANEIILDATALPSASQLRLQDAHLVVGPYIVAHRHNDALEFLYAQRRQYFEKEQAHGAYMAYFLTYSNQLSILEPPQTVTDNCAVLLTLASNEHRWVIIENDDPLASRGEFPVTNELSQRLIGRKVDDTIALPGIVHEEKATIYELQSKYVRAFQDCIQNFRLRFPETSALQQIDVGTPDNFDPSKIIDSLERRRQHVDECLKLYRERLCSVYLFASRVGINEVDAIRSLASHESGIVKCCQTTPDEFEDAASAGFTPQPIVLDLSAIITLTLFDAWSQLSVRYEYFVSQLTSERIDAWLHEAEHRETKDGGTLMLDDSGGLVVLEATPDERTYRLERIQRMRSKTDQYCQKKSSLTVAKIDPKKRELYEHVLGMHNLETIGVASECDGVLWSDDVVVGFIGKSDFGVGHVWTQLALKRFHMGGSVQAAEYNLITAKLLSWQYSTIIWNAHTLIAAGEEAKWDSEAWPLKQCFALVRKSRHQGVVNARIVFEFFKLLRRSSCIELKQSFVIRAALDALGSPRATRWMLERIHTMFLVDIASAEFVQLELQFWLRSRLQ